MSEAVRAESFVVSLRDGRAARVDVDDPAALAAEARGADVAWANVEVDDLARDGERVAAAFGFAEGMVERLLRSDVASYDDRESELGLLIPMIRVEGLAVQVEPLLLLLQNNFVLTVYARGRATRFRKFARYAETVLRKIPPDARQQDKLTLLMTRLLNENNERNFDGIRPIEDEGEKLGGKLSDDSVDRRAVAKEIYAMKRGLIAYLDALWSSLDVIHYLRHGDAELVSDDETLLQRLSILGDDVRRHIELSEHLSEVLASGLEVMQSIYNNQLQLLNNRMAFIVAWLTVLGTAVLVPNTLATVFGAWPGGTPFPNPWVYASIMLGSTAVATLIAWVWVKRAVPIRVE